MADTKLSALSETSVPDLADVVYAVDVSDATDDAAGSSRKSTLTRALALGGHINEFRLTTETGVEVSVSDRLAQGTLYWTPIKSGSAYVRLYDGTRWRLYQSAQISLALTLTVAKNYDVFVYDNAGTLTIELSAAWTNDTTRADALALQNSVTVKSGATTRMWVGTIRASATDLIEDSAKKRFMWNAYNKVEKHLQSALETANTWSYTTDTYRQANGNAANQFEFVTGDANSFITGRIVAGVNLASNSARTAKVGVGLDSTTAVSGLFGEGYVTSASSTTLLLNCAYQGYPGLGYHYLSWVEKGADGTCSFLGDNGGTAQSGIYGNIAG